MLLCRPRFPSLVVLAVLLSAALGGCTIEPLNPKVSNTSAPLSSVKNSRLSNIEIVEVSERVAQQVRNHLIFGMYGGGTPENVLYSVSLGVTTSHEDLVVLQQTRSPTSAQVTVTASYLMKDASKGTIIAQGSRTTIASYDRTTQSFANQRAKRDAENRAAREIAELLKFAIAAALPADAG